MIRATFIALSALALFGPAARAQAPLSREEKVRRDKQVVEADGFWIYNDLPKAFKEAKASGQPIVVVLRCIPCEECVKLDDDLVNQDERLQSLLQQFVRVRVISANGLDLSLFQFDTDQSFAVFLLNADGTIYGRYGTRSDHSHWADDVSIAGLAKALEGALALHKAYPANKASLAAKTGPKPTFAAPEKYPSLKDKFGSQLDYEGNVVRSCIHCHQIGDAEREFHLEKSGSLPERVMFPYPHPKSIGLILDPQERAAVLRVEPDSPAARAGFQAGDVIESLAGQPLLSMADVQWVLHHVPPEGGEVQATVRRGGKTEDIALKLPAGWRKRDDIAWRASSWQLRRFALGGMFLKNLGPEARAKHKLPEDAMALRIEHVGQYAPHDRAKQAGFRKDDIIVAFDGRDDLPRETDLLDYALNEVQPGQKVKVTILRNGQEQTLALPR